MKGSHSDADRVKLRRWDVSQVHIQMQIERVKLRRGYVSLVGWETEKEMMGMM